jgi:integrase/recombinase XerC
MAHRRKVGTYNKRAPATPARVDWTEAIRRFLAHLAGPAERSPYTYDHYRRDLDHFAAWWEAEREGQPLEPGGILGSDLRDWKEHLRSEVIDPATGRLRKPAAVNARMAALRSFITWAQGAGVIADPPQFPKRVRAARLAYKAIPRKDQKRLIRHVEGKRSPRDLAILHVLLDCGLRVSELCALKWRDVEVSERKGDLAVWEGKGGKHRSVPIGKDCRRALEALRGGHAAPDAPVFPSRKGATEGKPLTPRAVQKLLERYGKPLGLEISPHMCRHSCAKDMLDRGVQVTAVQAILGHDNVTTTLGYLTSSPEDLRRAVEREGDDE